MNKLVSQSEFQLPVAPQSTQGAQDWQRLHWTLEKLDKATELGLFGEFDHIELIGGELVPMAAKGNRHERIRHEIAKWLRRKLPDNLDMETELGWRPGSGTYLEPDILIFNADSSVPEVLPLQVKLLIEVAHSSLNNDLGPRAVVMAALGVRSYWVVNAVTLDVRAHDDLTGHRYTRIVDHGPADLVTPPLVPELALRMADLRIDG